jgi:hypothetical protein
MPFSGMLRRVAVVRTDVSEERRFPQEPHGVTSQKTAFFKDIPLKTGVRQAVLLKGEQKNSSAFSPKAKYTD